MTIDNPRTYVDTLPDWSMLDGCFDGLIRPMDIDGMVEHRGMFLILEQKTGLAQVKQGQSIAFMAFTKQQSGNVVIAFGARDRDIFWIHRYVNGKVQVARDPSLEVLRRCCSLWFRFAHERAQEAA